MNVFGKNAYIKQLMENIKIVDPTPEELEEEKRLEYIEKENRKQKAFESSGIGERYYGTRLNNIDLHSNDIRVAVKKVMDFIGDIAQKKYRTLWICGKNGTGKTMLSSVIVRECFGHYIKSRQLVKEEQDRFTDRVSSRDIIRKYANYRLLVIDEVGKSNSPEEANILFEIIDERYERRLPTVLVSNLSKKDLRQFIGMSCYDRFVESCTAIEMAGESYRSRIREE